MVPSAFRPVVEPLERRALLSATASDAVIGKYTWFGDADLDGEVTGDDYVAIDSNLGGGDSWIEGDFNFTGAAAIAPPSLADTIVKLTRPHVPSEPPREWRVLVGPEPQRQAVVMEGPNDRFTFGDYVYTKTGTSQATLTITEPSFPLDEPFATTMMFFFTSATAGDVVVAHNDDPDAQYGSFELASSVLAFGVLEVRGTNERDDLRVNVSGDDLLITHNGVVETYPLADVSRVNLLALGGDDKVTLGDGIPGTYANGGDGRDMLTGGSSDETLSGAAGPDRIDGGGGNDRINGNGSRDSLAGGAGDDRLYGGEGDDTMSGLTGRDRLWAGNGNDNLNGGTSADKLLGEGGDDVLAGGEHNDRLDGGPDHDTLVGQAGNDALTGGSGNDTLHGGAGIDSLFANAGDDQLFTRDSTLDLLDGGPGNDAAEIDNFDALQLTSIEIPIPG